VTRDLQSVTPKFSTSRLPHQLWIGLVLIATSWPLSWLLPGPRTHLLFFSLWLGYALTVDGLVWLRKGTSLLTRSRRAYGGLFLVSAPAWWLFELINWHTRNWQYVGKEEFTDLAYAFLATLSFSTVIPAVFGTAEFISTLRWVKRLPRGPIIKPTRPVTIGFFLAGWVMLALLIAWPRSFFPFVWLSVYFILEPINVWLGNRSLADNTAVGDWRPVMALWVGTLVCGFFWEMWNFYSYPKWVYHVPFVDFMRIFEMPILGYGGYLPFGLELFALYQLLAHLLSPHTGSSIQILDK
jgi:hypothetical protein